MVTTCCTRPGSCALYHLVSVERVVPALLTPQVFNLDTNIDVIHHHGSTDPLILVKVLTHAHGIDKETVSMNASRLPPATCLPPSLPIPPTYTRCSPVP